MSSSNIGGGMHGSVVSKNVAIKAFYKKAQFKRELKILNILKDCDNIVKMIGYNQKTLQIILERCSNTSLEDILSRVHVDPDVEEIWNMYKKSWWSQCYNFCKVLAENNIHHNDFKAKNILFRLDPHENIDYASLVLIDFSDCKFSDYHMHRLHIWTDDIDGVVSLRGSKEAILARQINDGISFKEALKSFS